MRKLAPKAKWLLFLRSEVKVLFLFIFLSSILIFIIQSLAAVTNVYNSPFAIILSLFVLATMGAYIMALLIYKNYEYNLEEEGFRKKHGVITKKDVSIPYEKIQNVDIERSIFARILGIAEVKIHTAGEPGFTSKGSFITEPEGFIPGVLPEEAERIRKELTKRAKGDF